MKNFAVTFYPDGKKISVPEGTSALKAAAACGIFFHSSCGGEGICGRCRILIRKGSVPQSGAEGKISEKDRKKGYVLACRASILSDAEIEIPPESRQAKEQILTEEYGNIFTTEEAIKEKDRQAAFPLSPLGVGPGDVSAGNFGIAADIGTTSVVTKLADLSTGEILGTKAARNTQARHGDDIITRIIFAEKTEGLEELHRLIIDNLNGLISALADEAGIKTDEIRAIVCAGNTTMLHLLLKINPAYLRRGPCTPAAASMPLIRASETGIRINPGGLLACLPGVSSYVGADIVAGVLASGIYEENNPCLLIDMGTNGEIALGSKEWLACCAASAGPAFEGSGVRCGVWAMEGAIQKIEINPVNGKIKYSTIGGAKPVGICGSGYIECIAEMLRSGIIDRSGRIKEHGIPGNAPTDIRKGTDGLEMVLVKAKESASGSDIVITQADITNLILSKGAIYTAASVLLKKTNLKFSEVEKIYLAGGFGSYLSIDKSICIGLLPDVPREKFRYIGNSSLAGAKLSLLSGRAMEEAGAIAKKMTYIELSTEPSFMNDYTGSLFLPHTDLDLFPTSCLLKK